MTSARTSLPRLHRRGPIEAGITVQIPENFPLLFHGFIAVAPLKLVGSRPAVVHGRSLPRLHRRGPIEAMNVL